LVGQLVPGITTGINNSILLWAMRVRTHVGKTPIIQHLLYDFDRDSYAHAKTLLERALAIDPESAEANIVLWLINHQVAIMVTCAPKTPPE